MNWFWYENYTNFQFKKDIQAEGNLQFLFMNLSQSLFFIFLITLVLAQTDPTPSKIAIELNDLYNITLEKGKTAIYTVTVKGLNPSESLFVEAASPTYDPYQIPTVTLKSDDNYSKLCTQQTNEFLGICEVPYQNLKQGKKFDIEIKCHEKCALKLQSFLSDTLEIEFGQKIGMFSQKSMDTLQEIKFQVPQSLNYTEIFIIANFLNQDDIDQGAQMYINVGRENATVPKPDDYMYKGRQVWGNGIGVFLNSNQTKPGDWIKVLIILGVGVDLEFYSQSVNGDTYDILLNTAYKDFTSEDDTKTYVLDLTKGVDSTTTNISSLSDMTIEIIFVIYSGVPTIKVGFDQKLTNYMDNYDIQGTFSYLLTPQIRKQNNFTGIIYIQVKSFWSSNYYLYTMTVSDKFYELSDGLAQLNRAEPNQIHNYIYQSFIVVNKNVTTDSQSYKLKIQIIDGIADVGIRRCKSLEKNNSLDCLLTNVSQLQDQQIKGSFDELNITLRSDWDVYELFFQYQASNCQVYKQYQTFRIYNCQFQIVVFPGKTSKKSLVYSVTMYQNRQQGTLKQSYAYKDFLYAQTYHYYQFQLPDDITKVQQVMFFMTVISGDAAIMGTTNQKYKYMEFTDISAQEDIYLSLFNSLTFKKDKLGKKFYLAIFAYEASDVTLSVIVKRGNQTKESNTTDSNSSKGNQTTSNTTKNQTSDSNSTSTNTTDNTTKPQNTTQISTLYLSQGLSQQYTLGKGYQRINFAFTSNTKQKITVDLIEIQGTVTFTLTQQGSDVTLLCTNEIQPGEQKCTFDPEQYVKYVVHVSALEGDIQTFSISYYTAAVCKKYSFNLPQFVFLAAKEKQCSSYSITDKSKTLQVITSFSTIDLLSTSINFKATFNDDHSVQWSGRQKQFTADQLKEFCKSSTMSNCNMKLEYIGDDYTNQRFYFVVEQVGKEMALFDGIVRKVVDQKMTQTKGKFFYYEVTSMIDSVKIFTTNRDNVGYYVGAKFVDIMDFTASPDSLYLPFRENISSPLPNTFETKLKPQKGTSVIQIQPQKFNKACKECVILISVYGLNKQSSQANIFQIQVTQTQSYLYLGQAQTGFLSEDEIYVYDIYGNPNAQSLILLRDFMKESDKEVNCYVASISEVGKLGANPIAWGQYIVPKSSSTFKVYIENVGEDICAYQISFSALAKPVSEITSYMPIELKLQNSQTNYFLHYHREESSFQVLNYVKSGDIKISANRVNQNFTIQTLMNKNIDMYDFVSHAGDSFLEVTNGTKFCINCYYMIAVRGDPNVQSEMAIVRGNDYIGLTTYGILKQTLKNAEKESYVYYSIFDFNVSIPLLFGQLRVIVLTPDKKTFYNQTINMSTQIVVPKPNIPEGQFIDFYNDDSRFEILVEAVKDSSYYISIKRRNVALRVYEGIPMTLSFANGTEDKTVEFVNMNADDNVSILLEIKDQNSMPSWISVTAQVMKQNELKTTKLQNPETKTSQNSMNYVFKSVKGTYFINFRSNMKTTVSFVLVKKKLTHLMSSNANLFTEKGTFEIYTPGHNFMIVVDTCLSEVQVKASEKYQALKNNGKENQSLVLLQHANYGGHYVITAQNVQGQYFVQVNPKNPKDNMLYIISYFYYDKNDHMPYSKVDVDSEISYQLASDKIIFQLNPVRKLPSKQKFKIIPTYTLFISNNSNTTTMNSRCDLNVGFSVSQTAGSDDQEVIKFPIDYKTIARQVGQNTDVYYVSAKVKVKFQGQSVIPGYAPYIDLAYIRLQLTQSTHTVQYKSQTTSSVKYILLWIVVPVIISLILFGLALKFCINKYRMLYPSTLVEEDMGESEDHMKNTTEMKPQDSLTNT